ncbi:hypothetical protein C7459_11470 [Tumebacillus permanentifrigoris]|uniref:Uncharacterized protein n=1 Tax=Tumebacillus permanentifrigoris TaxID=378543 RepID=A0A316D643_9BACL|nr:hypothetical protein C7459_11470 [Tumebacillus permanentifrigoris]
MKQFLKGEAKIQSRRLFDEDRYGLGDSTAEFAKQVLEWSRRSSLTYNFNSVMNSFPCRISEIDNVNGEKGIGEKLRKFLNKHWGDEGKRTMIHRIFREHNLAIIESETKQKTKMIAWADDPFV